MQPGNAWLRSVALAAALVLLNASLTFESAWPTPGVRWRGALSPELAVLVLALAAAGGFAGPSSRARRWLTGLWALLVFGHYAEVTAAALYGRDLNLFWDLRFVPDVVALMARPERIGVLVAAAIAALLAAGFTCAVVHWSLGRVGEAMASLRARRGLGALAAVVAATWIAGAGALAFAPPVTATYARQARLMVASVRGATALAPSPPMNSDLSLVAGADVFVIFIEAYGAVSFERPEFAARLAADRVRLEAAVQETNRAVVSAYVESPTFGGSSWLAHISLLSGVDVRDHDTNALLMAQSRDTLVSTFKRRGYRTVAVMPGLWQNWPEGAFYGFDDVYGGERLDYRGPQFGWWSITDQFALAKLDALEVSRAPRPPLFVFFPTVSTHVPFTPTPPYQPDWSRMLTETPYEQAELVRAYDQQPDWLNLGPSYANAVSYVYRSLSGYVRQLAGRDAVVVLIGDHQPAAAVTGEGASWDVPVHVITGRRPVLDRLREHGFRPGLTPAGPALGRMHELTPVLLEAFGNREALPAVGFWPE